MRKRGERVLGPYPHRGIWRVIVVTPDAARKRRPVTFPTRERAAAYKRSYEKDIAACASAVNEAIDAYEKHLIGKGNAPVSVKLTLYRIGSFFPDGDTPLNLLTRPVCARLYRDLAARPVLDGKNPDGTQRTRPMAPDTHRNMLLEARSFLRWCVGQFWIKENPLEGVEGIEKRRHGKKQLRFDEARTWRAKALELAPKEPGAVAALMTLLLGMRASEITGLLVRDVDDEGRLLWITKSKTKKGERILEVGDDELRALLVKLAGERPAGEYLFRAERSKTGRHDRKWPLLQVQRICTLAGVEKVTAHGMRGLNTTLGAVERVARGLSLRELSDAVGHESTSTTTTSYIDPEQLERAKRRRALTVLDGGKDR